MKRYCIEAGEETRDTKILKVTLDGDPFAVATYLKGQRNSKIRINPNAKKDDFIIDTEFEKMHKTLKNLLFQVREEEGD